MVVREGYKLTEVGVIPEDWVLFYLGKLLNGIADVDHYMPKTQKFGIPYVMTGDLKDYVGDIDFDSCKKISFSDYRKLSKKVRNLKGDIILARYATVGTVSYVNIDLDFVVSYSCVTVKADKSKLNDLFLYNYFKSHIFRLEVKNKVNANIQDNVGIGDLLKMQIPLPPTKSEQTAIATALSDADALIHSMEKLIKKKRAIKQGAMQELLKPKEGWVVKTLLELTEKIMVGIASSATHAYRQAGVIMFRNQNIKSNYLDDSDLIYISPEYESIFKNKRLRKDDLLTARTGYPGTTCLVPEKYQGSQSFTTLITRVRPLEVNVKYLSYYINSDKGQGFFEQNQIGGGQKNVNAATLKQMPIWFPITEAEQQTIVNILSEMDSEISALEQKLTKCKILKQGMMQELLTGRIRLV